MLPPIQAPLMADLSLTQSLCEIINSPRSLAVAILIRNGEWTQLLGLSIDASDYEDVGNFADDYLITNILKKNPRLPTGVDTAQEALRRFYTAEERCRATNLRFCDSSTPHPGWFGSFKREVQAILGPLDQRALNDIQSLCRHGSGASIGVKGNGLVTSDKYDNPLTVTEELLPFYDALVGETWAEYRPSNCAKVVKGNKFFSVPKDASTDRGACTEPTLNVYFQLGIGAYLAKRLRIFGVDIETQELNRALASMAEIWRLATIDLVQASDYMSWGFLLEALPSDWFWLLELASCRFTEMPDKGVVELEKFCSMGNGFTFTLQSVIFLALVRCVVPPDDHCVCAVYGDDIIVPQASARDLVDRLEYVGFQVNGRKSFLAGSFFESCGTDWFQGQNVRPFYLRQPVDERDPSDPSEDVLIAPVVPCALSTANGLRLWARRRAWGMGCDSRFRSLWKSLLQDIPHPWGMCRVPPELGDTGLIVSDTEGLPRSRLPFDGLESRFNSGPGWEGIMVRHIHVSPLTLDTRRFSVELAHLHNIDGRPSPSWDGTPGIASKGFEPRRGYLGLPNPTWSLIKEWPRDLG